MTDEIKIEKNISIPQNNRVGGRIYPFNKMEIGNSILVSGGKAFSARNAAFSYASRNPPKRFMTKVQEDGTIRIWRTA